ncbi:FMN-binding negative transcriptional regulator [Actinoplanes sp. LDG1-01]|uniref:FMN-binding negative transcriptional regulator n=2 Tax=Paractinoplanes lichenicola TaxID=2802976 RepID=A0ABS1VMT8_9ACTN|nr:FMN-binding negative transcriptional regulator [Actinoplanes lichenicola]
MYREPDARWISELIRRHPLALLMTNGGDEDGPFGTHLPIITDPRQPAADPAGLIGSTLAGHMNRANPQWKAMRSGMPAVLSFSGPNGYVSPAHYEFGPAAPTWNYTAVQLRGVVEPIDSHDETLSVVSATSATLEAEFGGGWDQAESIGHFLRILPGVGAFRFTVTCAESIFKLSQEQKSDARERVCRHFQEADGAHRGVAEYMNRLTEAK